MRRFVAPLADDYHIDHISVLSQVGVSLLVITIVVSRFSLNLLTYLRPIFFWQTLLFKLNRYPGVSKIFSFSFYFKVFFFISLFFFSAPKGIFYALCTVSGCDGRNRTRNIAVITWRLSLLSYDRHSKLVVLLNPFFPFRSFSTGQNRRFFGPIRSCTCTVKSKYTRGLVSLLLYHI